MSTPVTVAVITPTGFPEIYPNRIDEDIYDSLASDPAFVFNPFGPTLNSQ